MCCKGGMQVLLEGVAIPRMGDGTTLRAMPTLAGSILDLLLGASITPNLMPSVLKEMFLLEMVKNDICLGGASKQDTFYLKMCPKKPTNASNVSNKPYLKTVHPVLPYM